MARQKGKAVSSGFGLVVDYLLVEKESLDPLPLESIGDPGVGAAWSTNAALTGIRLGITSPEKNLTQALDRVAAELKALDALLDQAGGMLLPSSAHPFASTAAAPRAGNGVLAETAQPWTCSSRIVIPFADDVAFGKLHTAIRMVLPMIPAISASSPFVHGKRAPALSARVLTMLDGPNEIPELMGACIPEVALDQADYYRIVLEPIARALADRGLVDAVDYQLANRRAAIPSFERNTITVTIADTQECFGADAAVAEMVIAVTQAMMSGRWVSNYLQRAWHESDLRSILKDIARQGGDAVIANRDFLLMFGMMRESATAGEVWRHLYQQLRSELSEGARIRMAHILDHGCLAHRILARTGERPARQKLLEVYRDLATSLRENKAFDR